MTLIHHNSHVIVKTAGLGTPDRMVFIPRCACGPIADGVGFDIGRGSWAISYDDLLLLAQRAREAREP